MGIALTVLALAVLLVGGGRPDARASEGDEVQYTYDWPRAAAPRWPPGIPGRNGYLYFWVATVSHYPGDIR